MKSENSITPKHADTPFQKKADAETSGKKEKKSFSDVLKKVGFSVWISFMVVGGILAFLTSLLLL